MPWCRENPPFRSDDLIATASALLAETLGTCPDRWLLVDVAAQRLLLVTDGVPQGSWSVSTAAAGLDAREDSGGTPPGVHLIAERIGLGYPPGTEFSSRLPTGRTVPPDDLPGEPDRDLILSRILVLEGMQEGINRGPGIDSRARYIYLHGTNHEDLLGKPVSGGCVRLGNRDIITVCDLVREGDPVVII